jgi:hypothetical protein
MRILVVLVAIACLTGGCAPPKNQTGQLVIQPDHYQAAFDITGKVLRECRFVPDRVDARAGVISTYPKHSAGIAMPWDQEQSSLEDELADLFNHQQRQVRVTFTPVTSDPLADDPLGAPIPDMRVAQGPIQVDVQVFIERIRRPGKRLNPSKVTLSSYAQDPAMLARGIEPAHVQTIVRDDLLSRRLAETIGARLEKQQSEAAEDQAEP